MTMIERPKDLTSEGHDWRICGCNDCDIIRWEYWHERGQ